MNKITERDDLHLYLGMMIKRVSEAAYAPVAPAPFTYYQLAEQLRADIQLWRVKVTQFATDPAGKPIQPLIQRIIQPLDRLHLRVLGRADAARTDTNEARQAWVRQSLEEALGAVRMQISAVPADWTSTLYSAQSPLTVHFRICEALAAAKVRVHYFDRYLKREFFRMYLRDLPRSLELRLITTAGKAKDDYGVSVIKNISEKASKEFPNYELRQLRADEIHDRNLRVDDLVFVLGQGADDAGKCPMNFSIGDSSATGHQVLDEMIAKATLITY